MKENQEKLMIKYPVFIRSDIEVYYKKIAMNPLNWLSTFEETRSNDSLPPSSVSLFLTHLLKRSKHGFARKIRKLVD